MPPRKPIRGSIREAEAYNRRMQTIDFRLEGEYVELNQLLKLVGVVDSGGAGKMLVAGGEVRVDGKTELRKTCKIRAGQVVGLGDLRIRVTA
jgi:ribosome-associated protein